MDVVGIAVEDVPSRRLIEAAAAHLELDAEMLEGSALSADVVIGYELVIADLDEARVLKQTLHAGEEQDDKIQPALIAVVARGERAPEAGEFEAVLQLPLEAAALAAQLGLILYAHRAYARRYQDALEELHLNRRIFRSVTSGISIANAQLPDMPLVYVNPAFEAMTGYCLEEVQGNNCRFLQGKDRDQAGLTLVREAIAARREVIAVLRNYRKDGTPFWNELLLSPIRNRQGELTHFVGIQMDVTERVEFEAALRESEKLAAVGRLSASIAHEINNPLESVMNLLYLAAESDDKADMKQMIAQADKELQRVAHITAQSLRFYKQSTRPQAIRVSELLDGVLDLHEGRMHNAGVRLERRERMTESIVCMESEIRQVMSNLVRNAIDAMSAGGGTLRVRSRTASDLKTGRQGVMLTFADTGSGIDAVAMEQLYKAFFTTKGIGGTGLGLWVSAEIVARHHGTLRVRSCAEAGRSWTVFELFLPYQGLAN